MYVSFHFSTKMTGGFTSQQKAAIINVINSQEQPLTLVHAFASREFLEEKGIETDVIDFFDKFFPNQVSFFDPSTKKPMRKEMFEFIKSQNGLPVFILPLVDGVSDEFQIVEKLGIDYQEIELEEFRTLDHVFLN